MRCAECGSVASGGATVGGSSLGNTTPAPLATIKVALAHDVSEGTET